MSQCSSSILSSLLYTKQLDELHIGIAALTELIEEGSFEEILDANEQPKRQVEGLTALIKKVGHPKIEKALSALLSTDPYLLSKKQLIPELDALRKSAESLAVIRLTTACKFEDADMQEMAKIASENLGTTVVFDAEVDPTIIGGAIVEHGSFASDYSIKTRLTQFREHWHTASFSTVHEN